MRERAGVLLLLLGAFVAARLVTALLVSGRAPRAAAFALHAAVVPAAQAAALALAGLLVRRKGDACASS